MLLSNYLNAYLFPFPLQPSNSTQKNKSSFRKNTHTLPTKLPIIFFENHSIPSSILPSCKCKQDPTADFVANHPSDLASLLQSCCTVKEARRIHTTIIKRFGYSETFILNNLISVYVKLGKLWDARKVFDEMSIRNVVSWTAILNGYLKIGSEDEVLGLFIDLIGNGIQPNSKTFVCILNLCSRRYDFELGKQVHACILKGGWGNLIVDSSIVYFYAQCGDIACAFRAFDIMPERDVISWTSLISACAQHGDGGEVFKLFRKMRSEGLTPNEYTVCSVLKACGVEKNLKFGRQLHASVVKKMFKDDVFVGTSLLSMYVRCRDAVGARRVFDEMKKRNTVTWTSMIAGYAQNGLGEEAISLFRLMKRRHISANNLTIVSILGACGLVRASSLGKEVHAQILKNAVESNIYIGSTLVWLYCKCREYVYAANVLYLMPRRDVVSWTAMISGCAHLGHGSEALKFLNEMLQEGVEPNPFTYSSALKACSKLEAVLQGKSIHSSVKKTCALSNVFVGSALIDMYVKCGFISEAIRVFNSMPERNLVSWKAMVVGYARNGLCREALQLMYRMQAEGLKVDDYTRTTVLSACGDIEWGLDPLADHCLQSS